MIHRLGPLVILALVGCGTAFQGAGAGVGAPAADLRPDDRVLLTDMSTVQAVAASFERVYVVYPTAVGVWLPNRRTWLPPLEAPAYEALARVFAAVIDPLDQSLWLAEPAGLLHLDPMTGRWERFAAPDLVRGLGIDPATLDGIWVATASGWYLQSRIGGMRPARPGPGLRPAPTLADAFEAIPSLRSSAAIVGTGPGLRPGRLTAAAPDPLTNGWFIGTEWRGLLYFGPGGFEGEPLRQGLHGDEIGAVRAVPDGVWVASDDQVNGRPMSLAFVSNDLTRTVPITGDDVFGLGADAVREMLVSENSLLLGTDQGVLRVTIGEGATTRWTTSDGLTDPNVLALEWWQGGVAVGMRRGLVFIDDAGTVTQPIDAVLDGVFDLYADGDTLWLGTDRGLAFAAASEPAIKPAVGWPGAVIGANLVIGVGAVDDRLIAVTASRLAWRDSIAVGWQVGPDLIASTGRIRAFAFSSAGVWLGGDRGAALVLPGRGIVALLRVGQDLPDGVTALAASDGYLWVGTRRGLLRVRVHR